MITGNKGIDLIKHFESLHDGDLTKIGLQPKMCPAGYWTEGYGHAILDDKGKMIRGLANKALAYKYSKVKDEVTALNMLQQDLTVRESMINSLKLPLTQNQFDALVSFCYNIGFANLKVSTLLKRIQAKASENLIRFEFSKWKYSDGEILQGLVKRRAAEADLFFMK
nr:lysozyme [uncultured Bacteroides sp.]